MLNYNWIRVLRAICFAGLAVILILAFTQPEGASVSVMFCSVSRCGCLQGSFLGVKFIGLCLGSEHLGNFTKYLLNT